MELNDELGVIKRGVVGILPSEAALVAKLRKSREKGEPLRVKLGIDPTGSTIHLGHMIPLWKLKQFQELGHHPILINVTFTGMVVDPEGRKVTRQQLSQDEILQNANIIYKQICKIIDPQQIEIVRNADWLGKMTAMDAVNLARKVTAARILDRHDFQSRLREGIPIRLHEIIYPLLMGYDSVYLKADIELGATEQTLNIYTVRHLQELEGLDQEDHHPE